MCVCVYVCVYYVLECDISGKERYSNILYVELRNSCPPTVVDWEHQVLLLLNRHSASLYSFHLRRLFDPFDCSPPLCVVRSLRDTEGVKMTATVYRPERGRGSGREVKDWM